MKRSYYRLMEEGDFGKALEIKLRQADEEELRASTGLEPVEALALSLAYSKITWLIIHDEKIEGVFGLGEFYLNGIKYGVPWLLATDKFTEYSFTFARHCKEVVKLMLEQYPRLMNFVDIRHEVAINWLKWLGFVVEETVLENPLTKRPFYKFFMNKI